MIPHFFLMKSTKELLTNQIQASLKFHVAYWNLIIGACGIVCIVVQVLKDSSKVPLHPDTTIRTYGDDVKLAGRDLIVSSFPLALNVVISFCFKELFNYSKGDLYCRIGLTISTFLFGLLVTLQYDIFQLSVSYEISYQYMLWCHRIVVTSISMYFVSIDDSSQNNRYLVLTTLLCMGAYFHVSQIHVLLKNFVTVIYLIILCRVTWRTYTSNQMSYSQILHSYLYFVSIILGATLRIAHMYYHSHVASSKNGFMETAPLITIYTYLVVAIVAAIIPGLIAHLETVKAKDEIIATKAAFHRYIAHELRTPLNSTSMGLEFCLEHIPENVSTPALKLIRETLDEVKRSCEDALEILNELLLKDKIDSGLLTLQKEEIKNVKKFVIDYISMFKAQLRAKNIDLELLNCEIHLSDMAKLEALMASSNMLGECLVPSTMSFKTVSLKNYCCESSVDIYTVGECVEDNDALFVDKSKIGQVIRNIVSNAIKFTPQNGTIKMSIKFIPQNQVTSNNKSSQNGIFVVEVKDSGAGISVENQARLFKEIVQFNPEKLQAGGGSGIGLWISKSVVDVHNGSISVHSEGEGRGTTFRLEVPMTRHTNIITDPRSQLEVTESSIKDKEAYFQSNNLTADFSSTESSIKVDVTFGEDSETDSVDDSVNSPLPNPLSSRHRFDVGRPYIQPSSFQTGSISQNISKLNYSLDTTIPETSLKSTTVVKKKFLLVDDSNINRKMLRNLLEFSRGHECEEAINGLEAIEMVKATANLNVSRYDVIFMDSVMPTMSGPDATRAIRELGYTGLIIGVTGNAKEDDQKSFMSAGLTDVIIKPLKIERLKQIIDI